jgi:hypothetical protein
VPKRRSRPTLRCLSDDLGEELPTLDVDLGELDLPWLIELRRVAAQSPTGQKRILSIDRPLVYRLRISAERGATWVDGDIVWLCAVRRREEDSDDDAFSWFAELHEKGELLPSGDDFLRDRAEAAIRLHRALTAELLQLVGQAMSDVGTDLQADLCGWLPCRLLVIRSDDIEEIWCALSVMDVESNYIREQVRDLLFAELECYLEPVMFEARNDWPTGELKWSEAVRLGLR